MNIKRIVAVLCLLYPMLSLSDPRVTVHAVSDLQKTSGCEADLDEYFWKKAQHTSCMRAVFPKIFVQRCPQTDVTERSRERSQPRTGISFSLPLVTKDPEGLHGYQFMLTYDPARYTWRQFNIYFDGGLTQFWVSSKTNHKNITILSAAPVIRYTFKQRGCITPYLDLSIGAAYLNKTRFDKRNLGIHFSFQDRLAAGVLFGKNQSFSLGLTAIHYSNANLSSHNSGISVPLMLSLAYRW